MAQQKVQQAQLGTIDADSLQSYTIGTGANGILKLDIVGEVNYDFTFRNAITDINASAQINLTSTTGSVNLTASSVNVPSNMTLGGAGKNISASGTLLDFTSVSDTDITSSGADINLTASAGTLSINADNGVEIGPTGSGTEGGQILLQDKVGTNASMAVIDVDDNDQARFWHTGNGNMVIGNLVAGTPGIGGGGTGDIQFYTDNTLRMILQNDGTLHTEVTDYELQVLNDDDIPNKKYVDDKVAANSSGWTYENAGNTVPGSGTSTFAHGLGSAPKEVQLSLVATSAVNGYSVGDEIFVSQGAEIDGVAWQVAADSTNLYVMKNSPTIRVLSKASGTPVAPVTTAFSLTVRAR